MNIQDTIEALQELKVRFGNVTVYTNGEYGSNNCVKLEQSMVSGGPAELELDDDTAERLTNNPVVVHIGGY